MMRRLVTVGLPVVVLIGSGPAALAAWTSVGGATGSVSATTVNAGNAPAAERVVSSVPEGSVALSWAASTLASGDPVTRYDVVRSDGTSSTTVCTATTTSCSDTSPVPGRVSYSVVPRVGAYWVGSASAGTDFQFDVSAPVTSVDRTPVANESGWDNDTVHITLTANDPGPVASGVSAIHYTINGGPEVVVTGSTAEFDVTEEDQYAIAFWAVDNLGNTEGPGGTEDVNIDKTAPISSGTLSGDQASLSATDTGGSGLAYIEYRVGSSGEYSMYGDVPITLRDGETIYFRAVDVAGNVETPDKSLTYTAPANVATTTSVASSKNPAKSGETIIYTATVSSSSGTPTGTVTFKDGITPITCSGGSQTLAAGQATCQVSYPSMGTHSITATYDGQGVHTTSTSTAFTQRIVAASVVGLAFSNVTVTPNNGQAAPASPSCVGTLGTTYTCTVNGGNNARLTANVVFVDASGTATPYQTDASTLQIVATGRDADLNSGPRTIPGGDAMSSTSASAQRNGGTAAQFTVTFTDGPVTWTAVLKFN